MVVALLDSLAPNDEIIKALSQDIAISARLERESVQHTASVEEMANVVREFERLDCASLNVWRRKAPLDQVFQEPLLRFVKEGQRDSRRDRPSDERRTWRSRDSERGQDGYCPAITVIDPYRKELLSVKEVLSEFRKITGSNCTAPRFVIIGPAGSGKTTLMRFLCWSVNKDALLVSGKPRIPIRVNLARWEAWAIKDKEPNFGLADFLSFWYRQFLGSKTPCAEAWSKLLEDGELLLLADGVDELRGAESFLESLQSTLWRYSNCPIILTCRQTAFSRSIVPDWPTFLIQTLSSEQQEAYIRGVARTANFDPDTLINCLAHEHRLDLCAANPLVLSILCDVAESNPDASAHTTRTQLYQEAVPHLLEHHKRNGRIEFPTIAKQQWICEDFALRTLLRFPGTIIAEGQLDDCLQEATTNIGYTPAVRWADRFRRVLLDQTGILQGNRSTGYSFVVLLRISCLPGGRVELV